MKQIIAIIQPSRLYEVLTALRELRGSAGSRRHRGPGFPTRPCRSAVVRVTGSTRWTAFRSSVSKRSCRTGSRRPWSKGSGGSSHGQRAVMARSSFPRSTTRLPFGRECEGRRPSDRIGQPREGRCGMIEIAHTAAGVQKKRLLLVFVLTGLYCSRRSRRPVDSQPRSSRRRRSHGQRTSPGSASHFSRFGSRNSRRTLVERTATTGSRFWRLSQTPSC